MIILGPNSKENINFLIEEYGDLSRKLATATAKLNKANEQYIAAADEHQKVLDSLASIERQLILNLKSYGRQEQEIIVKDTHLEIIPENS